MTINNNNNDDKNQNNHDYILTLCSIYIERISLEEEDHDENF